MSSNDPILTQASAAIKAGDKESARRLIGQALRSNSQNADAWYMAAYVTEDHAKRVEALQRALTIDPLHERAQKALTGLQPVEVDDPLAAFLSTPTASGPITSYGTTSSGQPIINVTVNQTNANAAMAGGVVMPMQNQTAFIIGFLAALFFGIYGVAHLLNGKIGGALGAFLVGSILWPIVAIGLTAASAGICLVAVLPLHVYFAWTISKRGATTMPPMMAVAATR